MEATTDRVSKPLPLHFDIAHIPSDIDKLIIELRTQRELNFVLMQQVGAERQRSRQLETFLNSYVSTSEWQSNTEPRFVPRSASYNSISTATEGTSIMQNASWGSFRTDSWSSFVGIGDKATSYEVYREVPTESQRYPPHVRMQKIARYKEKLRRHRAKCEVSREFTGRSASARSKPRLNGKFVKRPVE